MFAIAEVVHHFGVGGDGLVGEGGHGSGVADLGEAFGLDDFGGVAALVEENLEDFLGGGAVDGLFVEEVDKGVSGNVRKQGSFLPCFLSDYFSLIAFTIRTKHKVGSNHARSTIPHLTVITLTIFKITKAMVNNTQTFEYHFAVSVIAIP